MADFKSASEMTDAELRELIDGMRGRLSALTDIVFGQAEGDRADLDLALKETGNDRYVRVAGADSRFEDWRWSLAELRRPENLAGMSPAYAEAYGQLLKDVETIIGPHGDPVPNDPPALPE